MSEWHAVLTDLSGNLLSELDTVKDRKFTRAFNALDSFTFRAPYGHPLFYDLHRHALDHSALVKLYEHDPESYPALPGQRKLWFHGPLISSDKQSGQGVSLAAAGAFWRLGYRLIGKSKTGFSRGSSDRGLIARDALAEANAASPTGVKIGSVGGSSGTGVGPWYFKPVAEVVTEMSVPLDGFDWEVAPIERDSNGDIGVLNIYGAGGALSGEVNGPLTAVTGPGWESPSDLLTGGNTVYRLGDGGSTSALTFTGFDFSGLPDNAVITGITAAFSRYGDNGPAGDGADGVNETVVQLVRAGVASGSNKAAGRWPSQSATKVTRGGPTDLWGLTLTVADVQASNFGFRVAANHGGVGSGAEAWVERKPTLAVSYTAHSEANVTAWGFATGKFEYGEGTEGTVQSFGHVADSAGLMTRAWSMPPDFPEGSEAPVSKEDAAAITQRGLFEGVVEGDLTVLALREKLAEVNVMIRKQPRQVISLTPHSYGHEQVPRFGTDYIVGDIIRFFAIEDGKITVDALFRIYTVDVTIGDNGVAQVQPSLVPA